MKKDDPYDLEERRSGPKKKEGGHKSMHFTINKTNREALEKIKGSKSDFIDGLIAPMAEQLDPGPASIILLRFWNGLVDETKEQLDKGNTDTAAALCQVVRVIKHAIQPHLDLCEEDNASTPTKQDKKSVKSTESYTNNVSTHQTKDTVIDSSQNNFSKSVTEKINILQKMQDTIFLLESTIILHNVIYPDTRHIESEINNTKQKCIAFIAELNKIIQEKFSHFENKQTNQYQKYIDSICKDRCIISLNGTKKSMQFHNMAQFRDTFSQVILQMRNKCFEYCSEFSARITYEQNAISDSCNLVSASLNKLSQKDLDLVVESYQYDKSLDMFSVDLSELKMLSRHNITQVYWDKQYCEFDINSEKKTIPPYPDYTVWFYPYDVIDNDSKHTLTIVMQCAEFSFEIKGGIRKTGDLFLDYIKNNPQQMEFISTITPDNSDRVIPIIANMGGKIKDTIEPLYDKKFVCPYCDEKHYCKRWLGNPDSDGIPDKDGKKYRIMIKCPKSDNYVSLHRILNHIFDSNKSQLDSSNELSSLCNKNRVNNLS